MDIAKSETFKNFIILNKALLFLINLNVRSSTSCIPWEWEILTRFYQQWYFPHTPLDTLPFLS